jgi:hypothetical protein
MGLMFAAVNDGFTDGTTVRSVRIIGSMSPVVRTITYIHMNGVCANGV